MSYLKKNWSTLLLVFMLIIGICLLVYPTFANYWNASRQSKAIASYVSKVNSLTEEEYKATLKKAKDYNKKLNVHWFLSEDEQKEYNEMLDIIGTGFMGYIEVPKLQSEFPIYHGTEEEVLQIAIGHIPGTSLPVGGKGTHCVLSGHRGLPSAKLFTNLDLMDIGDYFILRVLNETFTYEVDQILIVEPDDTRALAVEKDKDLCTLITCTPYGINTHRLLVRGHRVANLPDVLRVTADAVQIEPVLVAPAIAIPVLLSLIIYVLVATNRHKRKVVIRNESN